MSAEIKISPEELALLTVQPMKHKQTWERARQEAILQRRENGYSYNQVIELIKTKKRKDEDRRSDELFRALRVQFRNARAVFVSEPPGWNFYHARQHLGENDEVTLIQSTEWVQGDYEAETMRYSLRLQAVKGDSFNFNLTVTDRSTHELVSNALIKLLDQEGELLQAITIREDGQANFSLRPGIYQLQVIHLKDGEKVPEDFPNLLVIESP